MSTSCTISYVDENNICHSVYCHNDGYPTHIGRLLLNIYNNMDILRELISHGNMSVLSEKINPNPDKSHEFDGFLFGRMQMDTCLFYHRDRGDDWSRCKPMEFPYNEQDYRKHCNQYYNYLFKNDVWYVDGMILTEDRCWEEV